MNQKRNAFTLVELLVVIGIIALLISILLPTLAKARESAQRVQYLSGVKQLTAGYMMYHQDHDGDLLWGSAPASYNGKPFSTVDPISGLDLPYFVSGRYPWRIAPYVDDAWEVIHLHGSKPDRPTSAGDPDAFAKAYDLSIGPTFGLNTAYLGGHAGGVYQGFVGTDNRRNVRAHIAFKATDVKRSSQQIVFAESRIRNAGALGGVDADGTDAGLHFVSPPRANGQRWTVDERGNFEITTSPGNITGLPLGRNGDAAVVGFFDGHAEALRPRQLEDIFLWAPFADAPDYDFPLAR